MDADYPGAIVVEAARYGYAASCHPRAWCLHTPEELADSDPVTPYYFHNLTDRDASTTYFVSYLGFVFQCVPEGEGAYANAVEGKPYPAWANSGVNLNLQTLSIEIEGYAHNIAQTMPRGSAQWKALVSLMAHRCKALALNPDWTMGHYQVSVYRSDPGTLDIAAVVADVKAKMEEDDMSLTADEKQWIEKRFEEQNDYIARMILSATHAFVNGNPFGPKLAVDPQYTQVERSLKDVMQAIATSGSGAGLTATQMRAAAKDGAKDALREGTG